VALAVLWVLGSAGAAADTPGKPFGSEAKATQPSTFALNAYRASQPQFTLPFHLFNGHMLVDGSVNGQAGKFLFDTGTEFPFFLNNHYVVLAQDHFVGSGKTASGQAMVLFRQDAPLATLALGDQVRLQNVPAAIHTDWGFLARAYGIAGFLGSVGHGFNQNYVFVLDYAAQTIAFYAQDLDARVLEGVIDPTRVVARLAFTATGVDGKLPEVQLQVGRHTLTAFFDTGNQGSLELTEATQRALLQQGQLSLVSSAYAYGVAEATTRATLKGLRHSDTPLVDASNLRFTTAHHNRLGLGYQFLKNYVSVWDYKRQLLTLLKP